MQSNVLNNISLTWLLRSPLVARSSLKPFLRHATLCTGYTRHRRGLQPEGKLQERRRQLQEEVPGGAEKREDCKYAREAGRGERGTGQAQRQARECQQTLRGPEQPRQG